MAASGEQRRDVLFAGRVQGVGFRFMARGIAARFPVTGFVQNLRDGRVRLVAEGTAGDVERFVTAVNDEMARYIAEAQVAVGPATGEFSTFEVRA